VDKAQSKHAVVDGDDYENDISMACFKFRAATDIASDARRAAATPGN
jgi:hypothetical protein